MPSVTMRSCWRRQGLDPIPLVSLPGDGHPKTPGHRGKTPRRKWQHLELCCHEPGNVGATQRQEGTRESLPKGLRRERDCPHPGFGLQEEKKMPVVYATWFMVLSHGGPRRRACRIKTIFFSQLKFFHLSGDKWLTGSTPKGRKWKVIFSVHQPTPAPPQAHKSLKKMPQEETYAEALVSPGTMPRLKGVAAQHTDATRDTVNLYPTPGSKPEGGPSILS